MVIRDHLTIPSGIVHIEGNLAATGNSLIQIQMQEQEVHQKLERSGIELKDIVMDLEGEIGKDIIKEFE